MDNNGEPAVNGTSSVPASIWTKEKWLQTFSGLQAFGLPVIYFSVCIGFLGLLVTKIHHPSPRCLVGSHQMLFKGSIPLFLLLVPILVAHGVKQDIELTTLELASLRLKLKKWYFICAIFLIFGISFLGVVMMDVAQILFGLWRCRSPFTIAFMVLSAFFTVVADGYLIHSIYSVIYTP